MSCLYLTRIWTGLPDLGVKFGKVSVNFRDSTQAISVGFDLYEGVKQISACRFAGKTLLRNFVVRSWETHRSALLLLSPRFTFETFVSRP
jgi:hypothetical protein